MDSRKPRNNANTLNLENQNHNNEPKIELNNSVPEEENKMKKSLNLTNSVSIIVGTVIGSGIFVSPTGILKNVESIGASLIIWVLCGVYSFLGAYSYAELGTFISKSGGDYIYVYEAFGPFFGFLRLWVEVMVARPTSIAIVAMTFAKYLVNPFYPTCEEPTSLIYLFASFCILILAFANAYSSKISANVQDFFTYMKLIALVLIILTGFVQICLGRFEGLKEPFTNTNVNPSSLVNAFYSGLFAYSGWNYLNCMIEEMKNPSRDLPLAITISCALVTLIYTLTNIAYSTVLMPAEILSSTVAIEFGRRIYKFMWWIIPIFVACSTFGGVNGAIMTTSRIFFVASRLNQMPRIFCLLHYTQLTPIVAVIFTSAISLFYIFVGDVYSLIYYMGFVQWSAIGLVVSIVIYYRITQPNAERIVKVPIVFPILYVTVTIFLVIFSFFGAPKEAGMGVAIIVSGVPVYLIFCVWKNKPKKFAVVSQNVTKSVQKILQSVSTD